MSKITERLHQISLRGVNAYVCVDDDGLTIVDAGMPRNEKRILQYISETMGASPEAVQRILVTHADIDHAGSLAKLQAATGAQVFASQSSAELISQGRGPSHGVWLIDTLGGLWKYPTLALDKITVVAAGDTLPVLDQVQVLETPGHTPDHLSFFSPSTGIALTGDLFNTWQGKLSIMPGRMAYDFDMEKRSAATLLALNPTVFACGHGAVMQGETLAASLQGELAT